MIRATVDATAVAAALRSGCAQAKGTMPVLGCALIEADAEGLRITTTDLQVLVAIRIGADVAQHGATCARADLLAAAMTGGGSVELVEESGHLVVKRKPRGRVRVETLPPDQWPQADSRKWKPSGLSATTLRQAVDNVAYAARRGDVRPYCAAICVTRDAVVGCDGHRLALFDASFDGPDFLIPIEAVAPLRRALAEGGELHLGGADPKYPAAIAVVTDTARTEIMLLSPMALPGFRALVPIGDAGGRCVVNTEALRRSIKRLRAFCETALTTAGKRWLTHSAFFRVEASAVWLETPDRENRDDLAAEHAAECSGTIAHPLDITYLADTLDAIESERTLIELHASHDATHHQFVVRAVADDCLATHLISGMRL